MTKEARKAMMAFTKQVKRIENCYTGGGIYIYKMEMKNGRFALGATLSETLYVDEDPFKIDDDIIYGDMEWMNAHTTGYADADTDDYWDADDVWHELEKKHKPTYDGWDGYGERIVVK